MIFSMRRKAITLASVVGATELYYCSVCAELKHELIG